MLQRQLHSPRSTFAIWGRSSYVVGVGRKTVSCEFTVNLRSTRFGVFQLLHHNDSCAFTDNETISVTIKRPRSTFRFVIARAHRFHGRKSSETNLNDTRL